jgi:predicted lipid carrier protein YhbT
MACPGWSAAPHETIRCFEELSMTTSPRLLPTPVGKLLSRLPAYPGSLLFVAGLNLALNRNLPDDVKQALTGKKMRIHVRDAGVGFDFTWGGGRFAARRPVNECDLTISASAHDFALLACRQEDPDTLFFSRRLAMEGDTELGLLVKNTLDAIDPRELDGMHGAPLRLLAGLMQKARPSR